MSKDQSDVVPEQYRKQLREAAEESRKSDLKQMFGKLAGEMAAIPEGVRAQLTVLIDARLLHALRRIKELDGVKPQDFIRAAVAEKIARYTSETASAKSRKRA